MITASTLEMLDKVRHGLRARLSPARSLSDEAGRGHLDKMLALIDQTILPRSLEFTIGEGDAPQLVLQVNNSRVIQVKGLDVGPLSELDGDERVRAVRDLASALCAFCNRPGQLLANSCPLEAEPGIGDVGITLNEIRLASDAIVADGGVAQSDTAVNDPEPAPPEGTTEDAPAAETEVDAKPARKPVDFVNAFFKASLSFSTGRFILSDAPVSCTEADGDCAEGGAHSPSSQALAQLSQDLVSWDRDAADIIGQPQMIIIRTANPRSGALTLCRQGGKSAAVLHEGRKLGAAVKLWQALKREADQ